MIYVENGKVLSVSDAELITDPREIKRFKTVVEYRAKGDAAVHSKTFDSAFQAEAFVTENRAHLAQAPDGTFLPGKLAKPGNWDWFALRPAWFK